jgi:allophanate hydrolase subunit 1
MAIRRAPPKKPGLFATYLSPMGWRFVLRRCGDDLFSIPVSSPVEAQGLAEQLRASGDWLDVVPGIDSVVVRFDATRLDAAGAQRVIEASLKRHRDDTG